MKNCLILFCVISMIGPSAFSRVGTDIGNGGEALVCRETNTGRILRAEVWDLFEGAALNKRVYQELSSSAPEQARFFIPTLDKLFLGVSAKSMAARLETIIAKLTLLPDDVKLLPTEDVGNFIIPKNCAIEQALNFRDDGDLFADSEIWNHYSETQKAAAYIHELIYEYVRQNGVEETSLRTRTLVSILFSGIKLDPILPTAADEICRGTQTEFYLHQTALGKVELFFTRLRNQVALTRTVATASVVNPKNFSFQAPVESMVDRGALATFTRQGAVNRLGLKLGSEVINEKIDCQKMK